MVFDRWLEVIARIVNTLFFFGLSIYSMIKNDTHLLALSLIGLNTIPKPKELS